MVIPLNDSAYATLFGYVCDESSSRGLCRGRAELCHGFVEGTHRLSVLSMDVDSSDLSLSSSDCDQLQGSDQCESRTQWFHRVASKHDSGSVALVLVPDQMLCGGDPNKDVRPLRHRSQTVFYVPSPVLHRAVSSLTSSDSTIARMF